MRFFPQLGSGSLAQYPVVKRHKARTVVNESLDGSRLVFSDDQAREIEWDWELRGLSAAEFEEINELFTASEGSLESFFFIDPTGNALRFSEDLTQPPWSGDPGLIIASAVSDPFGTETATRIINGGQISQSIRQTIVAPGRYTYCFSGYFRAVEGGWTRFGWTHDGEAVWRLGEVGLVWKRFHCTGSLSGGPSPLVFQIEVPAGRAVEVSGLQVEGQREPSAYHKTNKMSGVYGKARFLDDVLTVTCEGADDYTVRVRIGAPIGLET